MIVAFGRKIACVLLLGFAAASCAEAQDFGQDVNSLPVVGGGRPSARIHTELGSNYFQAGHIAVALEELKIALMADSSYVPAYSVLGLVHAHLKENNEAERAFRKGLDLAPNDSELNNNYGWFLCQTGKERQSITYFLTAVKNPLYQTPERAYANAGMCAMKAGDLDGAIGYLQTAIRLGGEGGLMARVQLATLTYRKGNFEEAQRLVGEVLKVMEPASAEALWLALRIERKLGNKIAESSFAAQLRSRHPASAEYQEFLKGNFE